MYSGCDFKNLYLLRKGLEEGGGGGRELYLDCTLIPNSDELNWTSSAAVLLKLLGIIFGRIYVDFFPFHLVPCCGLSQIMNAILVADNSWGVNICC